MKKQIFDLSRALEKTNELKKKFDDLENQKIEQDDLIADEKQALQYEIETIKDRIEYKKSGLFINNARRFIAVSE